MHSVIRGGRPFRPLEFLARSLRGIEWIVAAEIEARFAARRISVGHRQVRFVTDAVPPLGELALATADDVFLIVGDCGRVDHRRTSLPRLRTVARELPWKRALTELRRMRRGGDWSAFTISASALGRRNYNRYEIEDRVAEAIAGVVDLPYRPTRKQKRPGEPELGLRVHLFGTRAVFALRLLDAPLHRRPYRQDTRVGALHPPLAAAMAILAGLCPDQRLLDPFAGVGTVPIEANRLNPRSRCVATDISAERLEAASSNARRARAAVMFAQSDAAHLPWADGAFDRVATNVPWRNAVEPRGDLSRAWDARDREIARVLDGAGRAVLLVDPEDPLCRGGKDGSSLTQRHRSWLSVRGRHPRLCVVGRPGSAAAGPIDLAGMWGDALARWHEKADTREA